MTEAKFLGIVVESILYAADPSFSQTEERDPEEIITLLQALKSSNPEAFEAMVLSNIELFYDESAAESALVNNIKELLGDKLTVVDARD